MSKRRAGVELTLDNWDREDEPEEAGVFTKADEDTLSKRPIIKAKRRVTGQQEEAPAQTPFAAFKGFTGFGVTPASTKAPAAFSVKPVSTSSDSSDSKSHPESKAPCGFGGRPVGESKQSFTFKASTEVPSKNMFKFGKTDSESKTGFPSNGSSLTKTENCTKISDAYANELKALNQSVSAWIQTHVDGNPVCDLTPIFDDYRKHLEEIERKRDAMEEGAAENKAKPQLATVSPLTAAQGLSSTSGTTSFSGFKFGSSSSSVPPFGGQTVRMETSSAAKPGFTFSGGSVESKKFGFGSATGVSSSKPASAFSFGDSVLRPKPSSADSEGNGTQDEESDEPPKVEVKTVQEKDSLFSTRCKLFYKKDGDFKERGVGMLHIKDSGGVGQIIVRADTSLGTLMLNIGVTSSMASHFTKQGKNKNNLMFLSPLNPPASKKCPKCSKNYVNPQESTACEGGCSPDPTPLLLRVKTEADADRIIEEVKRICG